MTLRTLVVLMFIHSIVFYANARCSDWHKNHFQAKKSIVSIDNIRKEHLALMMKRRAEIILESKVSQLPNLSRNGSYYFSSYSSTKGTKDSIDLIFNERGILLSYELTKGKMSDFFCLSDSVKE